MYHERFGLERPVADQGIPAADDLYVGAQQRHVMDQIGFGIGTADSVTVVTGPHGSGKTVLTQAALQCGGTRQSTVRLLDVGLDAADLPEWLLAELGVSARRLTRVERLQLWRQQLEELATTESGLYVIVERADAADVSVLRALEVLTAADPGGFAGANLVLHGTPELADTLALPALEPLRQRVRQQVVVDAMGAADSAAYWRHRLEAVGGVPDRILEPGVLAALHARSAGIARVIDHLGDAALALAAASGSSSVAVAHVDDAARRMGRAEVVAMRTADAWTHAADAEKTHVPVLTDAVEEDAGSDQAPAGDEWVDRVLSA